MYNLFSKNPDCTFHAPELDFFPNLQPFYLKNMLHRIIYLLVFIFSITFVRAQSESPSGLSVGAELQLYPTGILPGLRMEIPTSDNQFLSIRVGLNLIDHRDLGVHEDEKGSGWGFSLGYKLNLGESRWSLEPRTDIWFNKLDWEDQIQSPNGMSGTSNIVVIQPTLSLGYALSDKDSSWKIVPEVSFGFEKNVHTKGEPVGEGLILLVGIQAMHRL